ncbi:GAF domain-containing protein [Pedobacter boryungensis]|uniref:GAF domain-containing protein n=1 Tax=Pedobacter boryungensis TaxID=869962 RepID=A0ABX2DI41_9SPHI|nr:GAF domain-containing protein [Pedobacter boryungensis]NQX32946.1 GAF domain-containing protein [Pedobacter boryungensis]
MNTEVIQINKNACITCQVEFTLSFRPLIAYLKSRLKTEQTLKAEFYRFLLEKIEREEALQNDIKAEDLVKYKDTLELIFTILTPLMANEKDLFWALSTPVPDKIFFSTDSFHEFLSLHAEQKKQNKDVVDETSKEKQQLQFIYRMILDRFYNYTSIFKNEILYAYTNPETHLTTYYNINADTQFIDIKYEGELPELNFELLTIHIQEGNEIELLQKLIPLSKFKFDGFTVISLADVTLQHAIDGIRDALVNHTYENEAYEHVIQALKTLVGDGHIEFGLLPFLMVNNKFVFDSHQNSQSILLDSAKKYDLEEETFYSLVNEYKDNPRPVFFNNLDSEKIEKFPFLDVLQKNGIHSYSFVPIFYNSQLAGIMEIYSLQPLEVNEKLLSRLHSALPLLGQLLQYRIEEFNTRMDSVLKDKFTALQPSVQWKFNQVVWDFIKNSKGKKKTQEIETVTFKGLYPLFGAIDIRNSTVERNYALKEDLKIQLDILSETLTNLRNIIPLDLIDKILYNCKDWIKKIDDFISSSEEALLNEFLELEVYPMLTHIEKGHPQAKEIVQNYFNSINSEKGVAFEHRRTLETSMQFINTAVSEYLEDAQQTLQNSYPCYFAKFRTDGVEYDIYIGQDIAPDVPFDLLYLKNIRLWQLTAMVEVARLTNGLVSQMPRALLTTQLIFIHSNPIDISFRNDERRFDVEGAYNIRYEVVKKRIDKVLVKGTEERLTQPGKISLVYFNAFEANEYLEYIKYLQEQEFLQDDLEMLELEELQGVSGLKALRVGVNYMSCDFFDEQWTKLKESIKNKSAKIGTKKVKQV